MLHQKAVAYNFGRKHFRWVFYQHELLQQVGSEQVQGCHALIKTKFPVFSLCSCHFPCVFLSIKN